MASYRAPDVGGGSSIGGRTGEIFTLFIDLFSTYISSFKVVVRAVIKEQR